MSQAENGTMKMCSEPFKDHHAFINPIRRLAQKPIATGSYASAANLKRYSPRSGQLT
jgi:hypothetical protein